MRKTSIDQFVYIRILACFGIVLLHVVFASTVYYDSTMSESEQLWSGMAVHLLMWCVPCFLMVTGALLLDPEHNVTFKKIFGKYMRRILLALIVFTFLFQVLDYAAGEDGKILRPFLTDLVTGKGWPHMWYLYLMIGIYLTLPLYRKISQGADTTELEYLIALLLVFTSVLPVLESAGVEIGFYIPTTLVYPVYLFLGYFIHEHKIDRSLGWILLIGCSAVLVLLTFIQAEGPVKKDLMDQLFGYASPFVIGQACGVFGLIDRMKCGPCGSFTLAVDSCGFGIYLIHFIFVKAFMKWCGVDPYSYGAWLFFAMAVSFFVLAFVISWLIRKIPRADLL
jgi:surface polysaccharide O-acyltransferase-like enzyme